MTALAGSRFKKGGALQGTLRATRDSLAGLAAATRYERAFRIELALAALLVPIACRLGASGVERLLLIASLLAVLVVELLNSALEATLDRISLDEHPLVKRAKDMGSAAVLVSLANAVLVWAFLLVG